MFHKNPTVTGGAIALLGAAALIMGAVYQNKDTSGEKKLLCRLQPGTPISLSVWLIVSGILLLVGGLGLVLSQHGPENMQMFGRVAAGLALLGQLAYLFMGLIMYFQLSDSNMKVCQDEDQALYISFWVVWGLSLIGCLCGLGAVAFGFDAVKQIPEKFGKFAGEVSDRASRQIERIKESGRRKGESVSKSIYTPPFYMA